MAEYEYSLRVGVNKPLPTSTLGNYTLKLCSTTSASVTPPSVQLSLASTGTADAKAISAKCYTISGGSAELIASANEFGTHATATFIYIRENSGHTAANVEILDSGPNALFRLRAGQAAFLPTLVSGQVLYAEEVNTSSTGALQVVILGE
jgi:hypothetical protein